MRVKCITWFVHERELGQLLFIFLFTSSYEFIKRSRDSCFVLSNHEQINIVAKYSPKMKYAPFNLVQYCPYEATGRQFRLFQYIQH